HVALDLERHDQLRRRLGGEDADRVRLEREHGVGAVDHGAVADVDAVEGPDRDLARAWLRVGGRGDLYAHVGRPRVGSTQVRTTSGFTRSSRLIPTATTVPSWVIRSAPSPASPAGTATPCPTRSASAADSARSGRNASARARSIGSSPASSTRNGP